jgi:dehydrogenase/reductase SDR family member 12
MRVREVIEVRAPLEEAFAYVADFSTAAEWDPGIVQSRRVNNGPPSAGATYDVIALFRGNRVPFRYAVREYEENRRILIVGEGAKARSTDEILFEPTEGGTRIVYDATLEMKGLYRLAGPFVGAEFQKMGAKALAGLKSRLDAAR